MKFTRYVVYFKIKALLVCGRTHLRRKKEVGEKFFARMKAVKPKRVYIYREAGNLISKKRIEFEF